VHACEVVEADHAFEQLASYDWSSFELKPAALLLPGGSCSTRLACRAS
jgi:hypothetical protein